MIHVRIDNRHSTAVDIYVNISPKKMFPSSPKISSSSTSSICSADSNENEHIYDRLFHKDDYYLRQSKIVKTGTDSIRSSNKKNYTLQQILDNVETIQQQYEQITHNELSGPTSSCFFSFKQLTKALKSRKKLKTKSNQQMPIESSFENPSPFIFGGETLQWIAYPQDVNHIYENDFIH